MPRKCCVPECKSNYDSTSGYVTVFFFPKDKDMREKWLRQIPRDNFVVSKETVVCIKHFHGSFIDREHRVKRPDGTELVVPRDRPILKPDAYPSIFDNLPSYLSKVPIQRKNPEERARAIEERSEAEFLSYLENDKIKNFETFCQEAPKRLPIEWVSFTMDEHCFFMKCSSSTFPNFSAAFKITKSMTCTVFHNGNVVPPTSLKWLLHEQKCLNWSTFDSLLSFTSNYEMSCEDEVKTAISLLEKCLDKLSSDDDDDDNNLLTTVKFVNEQLKLTLRKHPQYSTDTLIWAATFFYSYPTAYHNLRNSKILILPHPNHLQRLLQGMGSLQTEISAPKVQYLKEKFKLLDDHEKLIGLTMDEIYVKPQLEYCGGKLVGKAMNSSDNAKTLQVFMISSLFSKNKDVVALFPMNNESSKDLHKLIMEILNVLKIIGYKVLFISADNNKVNRCAYEILGNGQLISPIPSPVGDDLPIYLLFDTVHLLKTIRNNWLNQRATNKTFFIPILESLNLKIITKTINYVPASISHLENVYFLEKDSVVKVAPTLSRKTLYPSNLERQNVKYAIKLFDEKLICALDAAKEKYGDDVQGTVHFISIISKWWKIVNVRTPHAFIRLKDDSRKPISSLDDENLKFLKEFCSWLIRWDSLDLPTMSNNKRSYKLSMETQGALLHTTETIIKLCEFLFTTWLPKPKYILLSKFQTDCLEARFGQYRTMNGCNYNVSVLQILESERKLKLLSVLKLSSSKKGAIEVKNIINACKEKEVPYEFWKFESFFFIIEESEFMSVNQENRKALIFIAGYVARVAVKSCPGCKLMLTLNDKMEVEDDSSGELKSYLGALDRGGLFWPNNTAVNICITMFKLFQLCISEKYEEEFLNAQNQKSLLVDLSLEKLQDLFLESQVCSCNKTFKDLVTLFVKCMSNILLGNYCKNRNDRNEKKAQNKKRKLATLTQM